MSKIVKSSDAKEIAAKELYSRIFKYRKRIALVRKYLDESPSEWGVFQSEFNQEVNNVFRDLMAFEKYNLDLHNLDEVRKSREFFIRRFRKEFLYGEYILWSLNKVYGYAGDFKIIDDIYKNAPVTTGFDRLFDNYFQMSAISIAVRNRKDDLKRILLDHIKNRADLEHGSNLNILNIACGPCREIYELYQEFPSLMKYTSYDCYDHSQEAIDYAKKLLQGMEVNFVKENVLRFVLKKDIVNHVGKKYDFIYCLGLFDYLNDDLSIRLLNQILKLLKPGGYVFVSDVRDRFSNPSVHFMELVGEWSLIYRSDSKFRALFNEAGFALDSLQFFYEQQGIMQYILAKR